MSATATFVSCMFCGRPWGAIGPHDAAEAEARDCWADWLQTNSLTSDPITIDRGEVVYVSEANSQWWSAKFDAAPEEGWWALEDVDAYGVPDWATSKLKRHPVARIVDCCVVPVSQAQDCSDEPEQPSTRNGGTA